MFRILTTRRWVILTLVFLALIPVCYFLGMWQFHRYQSSKHATALTNGNLHAAPANFETVSTPGKTLPLTEMYRRVVASGHYDTSQEFVVRQRSDASGDNIGFYVITPLVLPDGKEVLVNRGWIAPGANESATQYPSVPAAPTGTVTVTGLLRVDETSKLTGIRERTGLPARQFMLINSEQQAARDHVTMLAGYLELNTTAPIPHGTQPETVPWPNNTNSNDMAVVGRGVHLPYAIQWWVFALLVPTGWWILLRREVKQEKLRQIVAERRKRIPVASS